MPPVVLLSRECEEVVHVSGLKKVKWKHQVSTNATRLYRVKVEFGEPGGVGKVGEAFNNFSTAPLNTF